MSSTARSRTRTSAAVFSENDALELVKRFQDGTQATANKRIVEVPRDTDVGVLMRGYVYRTEVPVRLMGVKVGPTRFRTKISTRKRQSRRSREVSPCVTARVFRGGVGKAVPGVTQSLEIQIEANEPGAFCVDILLASEGGEMRGKLRGQVLDEATYRDFARTKLKLTGKPLTNEKAHKVGLIVPPDSNDLTSRWTRDLSATSLMSATDKQATDTAALVQPATEDTLPPCPEADAVEKILSPEEIGELVHMPMLPGCYWDRIAQEMRLDSTMQSAWTVDPSKSLQDLIQSQEEVKHSRLNSLEKKGFVSSRVVSRLTKRGAALRMTSMTTSSSSTDWDPCEDPPALEGLNDITGFAPKAAVPVRIGSLPARPKPHDDDASEGPVPGEDEDQGGITREQTPRRGPILL